MSSGIHLDRLALWRWLINLLMVCNPVVAFVDKHLALVDEGGLKIILHFGRGNINTRFIGKAEVLILFNYPGSLILCKQKSDKISWVEKPTISQHLACKVHHHFRSSQGNCR
jgi:hypothetical protein